MLFSKIMQEMSNMFNNMFKNFVSILSMPDKKYSQQILPANHFWD